MRASCLVRLQCCKSRLPVTYAMRPVNSSVCVVLMVALRIHISKPCYIGLLELGGYEMTLRGEMSVKV